MAALFQAVLSDAAANGKPLRVIDALEKMTVGNDGRALR
ncbi:hypothetical protein ACVIHH_007284 [Bradyrhizobium sp. USDA 4518]|nr:hypothetical protein [Bradyrhizobium sp. USDA 4541]MCP1910487.1 hypothetical protein [Bradyrhizobium elkanii]